MKIIDLTRTYETGQTVGNPNNHPTVNLEPMATIAYQGFNTSRILLGSHIGTHMDAQTHFIQNGQTIDLVDLNLCIGDVSIIDLTHLQPGQRAEVSDLENFEISERIMLVFGWARYRSNPDFSQKWPYLSLDAAKYLINRGSKLIATDVMSLDTKARDASNDFEVHKLMLSQKIIFIESLENTHLIDFCKEYYLIALPIKLKNLDGAPCRVVLIEKNN